MRFHRFTLATLAAVGLSIGLGQVATAQGISAARVPVAAVHNWTGFYIGLNAGQSWGKTTANYSQAAGGFDYGQPQCDTGCLLPFTLNPKGFLGGGQVGYNYQTGIWVWGVEADIQWRNREDTAGFIFTTYPDTLTLKDSQKWFGTMRGRIGLTPAPTNNWLLYATGGLAYGKFDHTVVQSYAGGATQATSTSPTKVGWTVGGGVEYALQRNWSLGAEYLYMDFGSDTLNARVPTVGAPFAGVASATTFRDRSHVARVKLNYKFSP